MLQHGADYALFPIESRIAGPVHGALDALETPGLARIGEHRLVTCLALLGLADSSAGKIREVLSHPMAWRECGVIRRQAGEGGPASPPQRALHPSGD